jgi:GT2 family glycosyltransferase
MSGSDLAALSVVVPAWNTRELLLECLASLEEACEGGAEIVVVDDASTDGSADAVALAFPRVVLVRNPENRGFAAAVNAGVARATREFVLLLNADARVEEGALESMLGFLRNAPGYAACAPRLVGADGATQRSCMRLPSLWTPLFFSTPLQRWWPHSPELERYFYADFDHEHDADVEQPPAAALLLHRAEYLELGGLDERLRLFFNDVDLCLRLARGGRKIRYLAGARVMHHGGASTRQLSDFAARWHADRLAYTRKHHGVLAGLWVKLCTSFTWTDHVVRTLLARARGARAEPLAPLCRAFGAYLRS